MGKANVAISGMGRIGRLAFRELIEDERFDIVALNDTAPLDAIAYLVRHSTEHGSFAKREDIRCDGGRLVAFGKSIPAFRESDARALPWEELGVDLVLDCTGAYTSRAKASAHLDAGAARVLVSAAAGEDVPTVVYGINEETVAPDERIVSGASCSTVGLAPLAAALNDLAPIERGIATTIHALTPTQMPLDNPQAKGNLRRSRTASQNIIPTTAAAAKAVGLVVPALKGRLSGSAIRVPVTRGSLITLHASVAADGLTAEKVNAAMKAAAGGLFAYTDEELVSSDIAGTQFESIFDATQTKVMPLDGGRALVEVAAWFDNETSYVSHFVKLAAHLAQQRG